MRSAFIFQIYALVLTLAATGCGAKSVPRPRADLQPGPNSSRDLGTVLGWGKNQQQAKDHALRNVSDRVEKYLRRHAPGLEWFPPKEYINDHLLKDPERRQDKDQKLQGDLVKCWEWTVEINRQDWQNILQHDRELRLHRRMALLGKILATLVVLLSVVVGYIRLDEWTKGFYTGWLRFAAGIVAVAGVGLWWFA
jgi:hypothetical protein